MRTLVLMRHAKSDYPEGVPDHGRPLAARGIREAALAGEWLRDNAPAIDAVRCSSAVRTRQTLDRTGIDAPVSFLDELYGASPGAVIGASNLHIHAAMRGETLETFQKTRNAPGALYSVAGKESDA